MFMLRKLVEKRLEMQGKMALDLWSGRRPTTMF